MTAFELGQPRKAFKWVNMRQLLVICGIMLKALVASKSYKT
jgi:hypothetical protein